MKVILFIVVLITSSYTSLVLEESSFIIGKWSLVDINGLRGYVNPEMEFDRDGMGKIIDASGEEIGFTYIILPYNKGIRFSFRSYQPYLDEKKYTYTIRVIDNIEVL